MVQLIQEEDVFLQDVLEGLSAGSKTIPSKYFYDDRGSKLFDRICQTPEYYPTRTEIDIMHRSAVEMAACLGKGVLLAELGSGSGLKTEFLLRYLQDPAGFVPIDISPLRLRESAESLQNLFPGLDIAPVCTDFTRSISLPNMGEYRRIYYFPGSTLGNFTHAEARQLLGRLLSEAGDKGGVLLGVDLKKDKEVLEAAYNDLEGVTEAFNKNLLCRINREFGANIRLENFKHHAFYNEAEGRIEMHLVSLKAQSFSIDGQWFRLAQDESICTEFSYKYSLADFRELAWELGAAIKNVWTDPHDLFSVQYLSR